MVDKIGGGALAREALLAALRGAGEKAGLVADGATSSAASSLPAARTSGPSHDTGVDFGQALESGIREVDSKVQAADALPLDILTGKVGDFHEIAVQLKSTEVSFKFAMEIRNKLVDAYREIMRMQV